MKPRVYVACMAMALVAASASALAQSSNPAKYTNAEIKAMVKEAHTFEQYQVLASYFRTRQENFEQQAQSEKTEWERRSQNVSGPAEKYPRPVDSAKNRYEYFEYEAQQMNHQAARYETLEASVK